MCFQNPLWKTVESGPQAYLCFCTALPDVPYCFDYWYDKKNPNSDSLLIFGNDTGAINLLTFFKPVTQLFDIPFKNDGGAHKIFMQVRTYPNDPKFSEQSDHGRSELSSKSN